MGIEFNSKQYQADRQKFNEFHKRNNNINTPAMRTAELRALAPDNSYARHQLRNQGQAEMAVEDSKGKTELMYGEAVGKVGVALEAVADDISCGAQTHLRDVYEHASHGDYVDAGKSMLQAGGRITVGAVKSFMTDMAACSVIGDCGKLLAGASKPMVQKAGQFVVKYAEQINAPIGMINDYLRPVVEANSKLDLIH